MNRIKTILATAYAINPYKGSEDGMGWNFVMQIARFNRVIAITRRNNRAAIEKYRNQHPDVDFTNVTFVYFDLPYWMRFWKKGNAGAMVYYWMWQRAIPAFVRDQKLSFDIVHNLNFHNDWTPSHLWKLNKPFVWGPVGHHPRMSAAFLKGYGMVPLFRDQITWFVKSMFWRFSPALKNTLRHARHILCMNSEVASVLTIPTLKRSIMPSVATQDFGAVAFSRSDRFVAISVGRLVPLKGFDLAIRSFARFVLALSLQKARSCMLVIVGDGPEEGRLRALSKELGVQDYVQFIPWLERDVLLEHYKNASVFLFPSHEGAGMVVAEALSFGLPVICLNNSGPGELVDARSGIIVQPTSPEDTVIELANAIETLFTNPDCRLQLAIGARERFESHFHWDRRGEELNRLYQKIQV